ncbi:programmed cell death 11, putative [Ichthyophthirius multifiliis]|uniref:Programmed cell death 11, putative n=1 Tax=Ichthyophthirius multifiliis TaxID=5932 RepID=G0QXP6_ICHMU|nr:programmed cell death 11, putative [Ichthyophthirius multifiliis]EGR29983.1 programmed cell death 11, putative [Ichthyophthirius multifiliis]|eukprot:XP_004031219.1 programmed cell death 11, putative [Ichthyophthirius multifiliis]
MPAWKNKYKDTIVDYFKDKNQNQDDDQMFNKMPILRENKPQIQNKKIQKKKIQKKINNDFVDSDEEFERMINSTQKKQKNNQQQEIFGTQETFFAPLTASFSSFFINNKDEFLSLEKVPTIKYQLGTQVLCSVNEYGLKGQFLIVNLSRNKKAFLTIADAVEEKNEESDLRIYNQGEYLIGEIVNSIKEGNSNISIKPSVVNEGLQFNEIYENMLLQGKVLTKEEYGIKVVFHTSQQYIGFLKKDKNVCEDDQYEDLEEGRVYMFRVEKKENNKKLLYLSLKYTTQEIKESILNPSIDIEDGSDFHHLAKPGNLVNCLIIKVLSNGLVVRFFKQFIGFIFEDHLDNNQPESYKVKERILARIIAANFDQKHINLSAKKVHVDLQAFNQSYKYKPGDVFTQGFKIKKVLYGDSYLVKIQNTSIDNGFLHKNQLHADKESFKEGQNYTKALKLKEINYFEHFPIFTAKEEFVKNVKNWTDLRPGMVLNVKVEKIIQGHQNQYKVKVEINENIKGIIDYLNTQDHPQSKNLNFKEGKRVTVRILSVNLEEKKLKLTAKQTLVNAPEDCIIKSWENIQQNNKYLGYISGKTDFGYIIQFFNNVKGLLTYKDIENLNKKNRNDYKIGQILETYVVFINPLNQKLALSLTEKGFQEAQNQKKNNTSRKTVFEMQSLNNEDVELNVNEGDICEYKVDSNNIYKDVIVLFNENHKAILPLEHLSDFQWHYEILNEHLRSTKGSLKCKIINIFPNKNVLVSAKASLLSNMNPNCVEDIKNGYIYTGYIDRGARKGIVVKFNERIKIFVGKESFEENVQFNTYDSVAVLVKNIENNKINATLLNENIFRHKMSKKISFFSNLFTEQYAVLQDKNKKVWQKFKVGNYLNTTVHIIKDFGIITKIEGNDSLTGFILIEHLMNNEAQQKIEIWEGKKIQCKIIDIDFEKEVLDLIPVDFLPLKQLINNKQNLDEFFNGNFQNIPIIEEVKVLVEKNHYLICIIQNTNIICYVNTNNINNIQHEKKYFNDKIYNVRLVNKDLLDKKKQQSINKSTYVPLYEQKVIRREQNQDQINNTSHVNLVPGEKVSGKILKKQGNNLHVQLRGKLYGKLHKTQLDDQKQFGKFQENELIQCKILYVKKNEKNIDIELTALSCHLKADFLDENNYLSQYESTFQEKNINQKFLGLVKSIDKSSIHPIYVELTNSHSGYVSAFDLPFSHLENIEDKYSIGNLCDWKIVGIQENKKGLKNIRLLPAGIELSEYKQGTLLNVKILKKNAQGGIRVQISDEKFTNIHISEICDEWEGVPAEHFESGQYTKGRILERDDENVQISLRQAVTNENNWKKALGPSGNTIEYKKIFQEVEKQGDLRNRLIKLGQGSLKQGMIFVGYINQTNDKGCFVNISYNTIIRVGLQELSDDYLEKPQISFYKNKLVVGRITDIKQDGKIEGSLRDSIVKFGFSLNENKIKQGMTVKGVVVGHYQGKASVAIQGCKFRGSLDKDDTDFTEEQRMGFVEKLLPLGSQVLAKVIKFEKEPKVRIILGNSQKYIQKFSNEVDFDFDKNQQVSEDIQQLINSILQINQSTQQNKQNGKTEIKLNQNVNFVDPNKKYKDEDENEEEEEEEEQLSNQMQIEQENDNQDSDDMSNEEQSQEKECEQEESEEDEEQEYNEDEILSEQSLLDEELEEDEKNITNKKKSQRQKKILNRKKEEAIREQEKKLINSDQNPETNDDYEKLVLKNPNSSYIWIQYIAFVMENENIYQAREIIERALKVINFANENEKLNLWTAYLNLEHNFGDSKSLIKVFERAKQLCKPKSVYLKLLEIYKKDENKQDLLFQLSKNMIQKFKHSSKCWIEHLKNVIIYRNQITKNKQEFKLNQSHDPKEVLKRALVCLKKAKHITVLSQYAKLQYQNNQQETGRTTFEAFVSNYPKRTDIWSVYLDMEIKYGTLQTARNLFDRIITMQYKPKQMKFFFKKYLQFEANKGNSDRINYVKQKAQEYVQSLIGQDNQTKTQQNYNQMEEENDGDDQNDEDDQYIEDNQNIEDEDN